MNSNNSVFLLHCFILSPFEKDPLIFPVSGSSCCLFRQNTENLRRESPRGETGGGKKKGAGLFPVRKCGQEQGKEGIPLMLSMYVDPLLMVNIHQKEIQQ